MNLMPVVAAARAEASCAEILESWGGADGVGQVSAPAGMWPMLSAAMARDRPVLVVTATGREADDVARRLGDFMAPEGIATFPSWETLPHERLSPRSDT
ncbi:MAG: hypothetical protein WA994_01105, partial [Ornithinimicrobium sp.]